MPYAGVILSVSFHGTVEFGCILSMKDWQIGVMHESLTRDLITNY
jgi:hypothetical protein